MAEEIPFGTYELSIDAFMDERQSEETYNALKFDFRPSSSVNASEAYISKASQEKQEGTMQMVMAESDNLTVYKGIPSAVEKARECFLAYGKDGKLTLKSLSWSTMMKRSRETPSAMASIAQRIEAIKKAKAPERSEARHNLQSAESSTETKRTRAESLGLGLSSSSSSSEASSDSEATSDDTSPGLEIDS